jgi:hypothetical protein
VTKKKEKNHNNFKKKVSKEMKLSNLTHLKKEWLSKRQQEIIAHSGQRYMYLQISLFPTSLIKPNMSYTTEIFSTMLAKV